MNAVTAHSPPPRQALTARPGKPASGGDAEAPRGGLVRLLVVDDDLGSIEYLGQLLKGIAQVSFATNGEDALRLARLQRPDLVLLDVELPGLDGFEICRRLRAMPGLRGLPIIFATQHADAGTQAEALRLGADDFLHKPFNDAQVLARLRAHLHTPAAPDDDGLGAAAGRWRILIIDDDASSIQLVRRVLGGLAECHFALDGSQALALVGDLRPDLVLLDIDLPGGDGFRVCQQLRADPDLGAVPIMFLTQSGSAGDEARALALGGDDFLRKPFNAPVLLARVRRLVARKAPPSADAGEVAAARRATASMLSCIAHEIGNPVNVIKGFAQLMKAAPLPAGQAEKLSHILEAVERLQGLLSDVSDVARMESGQFKVDAGEVELGSFLQQACGPARTQAAAAGISLRLPQPRERVPVRADARRLRQCLDNLLSNAIKYGRDGGHIDIEIEPRGGEVVLAVQDHGDGLSDSQLAHLFEPYNRLGRDGGAIPGTGLGLTLTRELVRAMGGRMQVHSDGAGRGCRFELMLRAAPAGPQ